MPATTPVLDQIGVLPKVDSAGFPRKYGAAWTSAVEDSIPSMGFGGMSHGFRQAEIEFKERDQEGVRQGYTYHVDRGKCDSLLLQHAAKTGANVLEGLRICKVNFEPEHPELVFKVGSREVHSRVRMVIDASGRSTFLGGQYKLKVPDPVFNQYAIHTWFEGLDRSAVSATEAQSDYIFIYFLPINDSWVWQIPITDKITSVGVVTQLRRSASGIAVGTALAGGVPMRVPGIRATSRTPPPTFELVSERSEHWLFPSHPERACRGSNESCNKRGGTSHPSGWRSGPGSH